MKISSRQISYQPNRFQLGISLVELMVAMAIGLVVALVAAAFYLNASNTQRTQSDVVQVNENLRFAFDLVTREIRKAGFSNIWQVGSTQGANFCSNPSLSAGVTYSPIIGLNDANSVDPNAADLVGSATALYGVSDGNGHLNYSDVLAVQYYGDSTVGTAPVYDCQGYQVAAPALNAAPVRDVLFIAPDAGNNNEPTLFCYTNNPNGSATQPLPIVSGIESFQMLYGEDMDTSNHPSKHYVPWGAMIVNQDLITSIKVSMVARGPSSSTVVNGAAAAGPWYHFSSTYGTVAVTNGDSGAIFPYPGAALPSDNRTRKMLSTEVGFRNNRYCS